MSLQTDHKLDGRVDTALQRSSKRSTSLPEARSIVSANPQLPKSTTGELIEPISIEDEEAQPNSAYVQGWKLHVLTLGYGHLQA